MCLSVEDSHDDAVGQACGFRGAHSLSYGDIQISQDLVDVLAHGQRVTQPGDVAHLQNLAPRFGAF